MHSFNYGGYVEIYNMWGVCYDQADKKGGTKGEIIIPKDEFKEFVENALKKEIGDK